ncbi:MAG: hypothetical protein ACLFNM_00310 [Candidatus Woesearchaeota archaeon]
MKIKKEIAGLNFEIVYDKTRKYSKNLEKELKIYSNSEEKEIIKIYIDTKKEPETVMNNPSIQFSSENIFGIETTFMKIYWIKEKEKIKEIIIKTKYNKVNYLMNLAHYFAGKDLEKPINLITKQLHELVFIPTIFFEENKTLFHGSCIKKNNQTILIGGTGGVGKTSALLSLNGKKTYFLADDMTIIKKNRNIEPNFAYPKIYAYNLIGNRKLKKETLNKTNILKKIAFNILSKISKDMVRKRVNPKKLFLTTNNSSKINKYIILSKGSQSKITKEIINTDIATNNTWRIIETEYSQFINHLKWHAFNCEIDNMKNNFDYAKIKQQKLSITKNILKNTENVLVKIPEKIKHEKYLKEIKEILK